MTAQRQGGLYFTYLWDWAVEEVGFEAAAVYGVIYRYCEMRDQKCYASIDTLAAHVGMTRQRFSRHLKTLVERGLVIDLTPDAKGVPHEYITERRAAALGIEVPRGDNAETEVEPVTKRATQPVTNHNMGCNKSLQVPVTNRNTSITTSITKRITNTDDDKARAGPDGSSPGDEVAQREKLGRILSVVDDRMGLDSTGVRLSRIREMIERYGIDNVLAGAEEMACSRATHINYIERVAERRAKGLKGPPARSKKNSLRRDVSPGGVGRIMW